LVLEAVMDWERRSGRTPPHVSVDTGLDLERYARRMTERYGRVDLDALMPPERDEQFRIPLVAVYVEQSVREARPPVELPKEVWEKLQRDGEIRDEDVPKGVTREQIEMARTAFLQRPVAPVFEALSRPASTRVVLLGDPGAGKSTLTRFLLLSLLSPV